MSRYLFFEQSQAAYEQITDLFDFVWPTAAAMWNLRWQVSGYVAACPEATVEDIERRFVLGSKIHGANLRRACVDLTWPEQQARFAKFLLIDTFAIYEAWIAGVLGTLRSASKANEKDLQFPSSVSTKGTSQGVSACLGRLHAHSSSVIQKAFYPTLLQHVKNSKKNLENLLRCYRYFKECRNALIHNGGSSTQTTVVAYADFLTVATPSMLDMKEIPEHFPPTVGMPTTLSLRGVVGFSGIILRLIATLDAELAIVGAAERTLENRWVRVHKCPQSLPKAGAPGRAALLGRLFRKLGLPTPQPVPELEQWALTRGLVS